ncbi:MAG: RHS repeat-associated core domain-containing protein, partial [Pseudomonadota bacterium]
MQIDVGGGTSWLHTDHLGSVRLITDAAGNVDEARVFRPYGEMVVTASNNPPVEDLSWIGARRDADAELMYLNARYQSPELGIFVSPDWWDPTEPGVGTNRYAYAGGIRLTRSIRGGMRGIPAESVRSSPHEIIHPSKVKKLVALYPWALWLLQCTVPMVEKVTSTTTGKAEHSRQTLVVIDLAS